MAQFFTTRKTMGTLSDVNMTPLVDLICTLLIIFMIIAPVLHKGIDVQVPGSAAGTTMPAQDLHIVSITKDGALWFDQEEVTLETLAAHLQQLSRAKGIYIQSDKNVPYGYVVEVISLLKQNGIPQVGLITNPAAVKEQP